MTEEDYQSLKKKVDRLEYDEIGEIKEDITEMKIELSTNNLLTKQSIDSAQKLSDTMATMKDTMIEITQSLKDSNKISSELTQTVRDLNEKVENTNSKMDKKFKEFNDRIIEVDEKSKVDILGWTKSNWFKIVITIFGASLLVGQMFGWSIF